MLIEEQEIAAKAMPGLLRALSEDGVMEREQSGAEALADLFREHGDPGFLVSRDMGGKGGSLVEMTQVLRLVGARCPSLAVMMTMHHHTVAGFVRGTLPIRGVDALLRRVAADRALVASAFSEGRPGSDILDSSVGCTRMDGGYRIAGAKKPCCMAHQAEIAVVGVAVQFDGGEKSRGIALVDTSLEGIRKTAFWPADILASAGNHALLFEGVTVGEDCVLAPRDNGRAAMRERLEVAYAEIAMSCLFQPMVSATYLGMASRLCELVLRRRGGSAAQRVDILSGLETAAMAVYRLAEIIERGDFSAQLLAQSFLVSHHVAAQVERAVAACVKALGGGGYLGSREAQYLVLASRCIDFHPPSNAVAEQVVDGCYTEMT
jgi:alkylation response protein AidB-like acyl-CoA dehydrogenase